MFKWKSIPDDVGKLIALGIFLIFFAYSYWQNEKLKELHKAKMHEKPALTVAKVLCFETKYKHGTEIGVEYNHNGHAYYATCSDNGYAYVRRKMVGKYFPLIVHADSPALCKILVLPKDFEEFHLDFPDSLQWLLKDH